MESHYLLGRAYIAKPEKAFSLAYKAYQQAVYLNGKSSIIWLSVAILYFYIEQYRDSLEAFSVAVRLQPDNSLTWRNLGILVCISAKLPRQKIVLI